jgi:hypothetical protein
MVLVLVLSARRRVSLQKSLDATPFADLAANGSSH